MRAQLLLLCLFFFLPDILSAQQYFPFRENDRWGLIDASGNVFLPPVYQAIGAFEGDYAIFQIDDQVGLINKAGQEILPARFEDIQVIGSGVFLVMQESRRQLLTDQGQAILDTEILEAEMITANIIRYRATNKWGAISRKGKEIVPPLAKEIVLELEDYLSVRTAKGSGLWTLEGQQIADTLYSAIRVLDDSCFAVQKNRLWGLLNRAGAKILSEDWWEIEPLGTDYVVVKDSASTGLFVKENQQVIGYGRFQRFIDFPGEQVLCVKNFLVGLLNHNGQQILDNRYQEIQIYDKELFRIRQANRWGLVRAGDEVLLPAEYTFLGPLNTEIAVVSQGNRFGIINFKGALVVEPKYDRVQVDENTVQAYLGESLEILAFNEAGELSDQDSYDNFGTISIGYRGDRIRRGLRTRSASNRNPLQLEEFEWFFHPKADKWGLRKTDDGAIIIPPSYDAIEVKRDLGFTVVGNEVVSKTTFDRTIFNFFMVYGIIDNKRGLPITPMNLWDIRFEDIEKDSLPVARVIFNGGRHGLINRKGAIVLENFTYIGRFKEGRARMSQKGGLSVKLYEGEEQLGWFGSYLKRMRTPSLMESMTTHDRKLQTEGRLICADCDWGFIDTMGRVAIKPAYSFTYPFKKGVAISKQNGHWGTIDVQGNIRLEPIYDKIRFVENSEDQMLRIYQYKPKYGLVDSSGRIVVPVLYDDVTKVSENRIAVKAGNRWGFVDMNGEAITPFHFERVKPFSEGLAAVRKGRKWGFINLQGEQVLDFQFKDVGSFQSGKAWVRTLSRSGYIDRSGALIIEDKFAKAFDFEGEVARVQEDGKYGLISSTGQYLLTPKYTRIYAFNTLGVAIVQLKGGGMAVIDKNGQRLTTGKLDKIYPFQDGLALFRSGSSFGFLNAMGKTAIPAQFQKAKSFSNGRAAFQEKGRWGFINRSGQKVVPAIYSKCLDYEEGFAVVYKGYKRSGLLDLEGNEVIQPGVDRILEFTAGRGLVRTPQHRYYFITDQNKLYKGYFQGAEGFVNHVAPIKKAGAWGLINSNGMELIPPKFDKVFEFENGFAVVRIIAFSGVADLQGNVIIPPDYELISYAGDGLFRVEKGNSIGYLNANGEWVWNLSQ
ncbi:MAG: WG repeat-containing protein [Bacteroidota bacterium]